MQYLLPQNEWDGISLNNVSSWRNLIARYIETLDAKPTTIDLYKKALQYFIDWLDDDGPKREDILNYRKTLQEQGLKANTINAYITSIRRFFSWLEAEKIYPEVSHPMGG